jgi:hypothetical protein
MCRFNESQNVLLSFVVAHRYYVIHGLGPTQTPDMSLIATETALGRFPFLFYNRVLNNSYLC